MLRGVWSRVKDSMLTTITGVELALGRKNKNDLGFLRSSPKSQGSKHPFLLARGLRKGRGGTGAGQGLQARGLSQRTRPPGSVLAVRWLSSRPGSGDAPSGPRLPPRRQQRRRQSPESGRLRFGGGEVGSGASPGQAEFSLRRRQRGVGPGQGKKDPKANRRCPSPL